MAKEIERRWLVRTYTYPFGSPTSELAQGYLELQSPEQSLRIRIKDDETAVITHKVGAGMVREEREEPLPVPAARILMDACQHRVMKTRTRFPDGWELDEFEEALRGVVLLEFENADEAKVAAAVPPPWIRDAVEVTDSLTNLHLARLATDLKDSRREPLAVLTARLGKRIPRIVITGGPGSGKTELMKRLKISHPDFQFVPEVATIVIGQVGVRPDRVSTQLFQDTVLRVQRIFEATSAEFALAAGKKALVMDRGTIDNAAYLKGGVGELERRFGTVRQLEYANYDLVIQLAAPPKDVYDLIRKNNPARSETHEEAVRLSTAIRHAWLGHPNVRFVRNDGGWEEKVRTASESLRLFMLNYRG